jgi:hypothetical protein
MILRSGVVFVICITIVNWLYFNYIVTRSSSLQRLSYHSNTIFDWLTGVWLLMTLNLAVWLCYIGLNSMYSLHWPNLRFLTVTKSNFQDIDFIKIDFSHDILTVNSTLNITTPQYSSVFTCVHHHAPQEVQEVSGKGKSSS